MTVYLDTSVVLQVLLDQPNRISGWGRWERAYSSELLGIECRRVIDRLRLEGAFVDNDVAETMDRLARIEDAIGRIRLTPSILHAAAQSFPTVVKTLDAFHLASAVALRKRRGVDDLCFVTHDKQQGTAARALGLVSMES
jgi:predicted nucleic acid-binding protein